MREKPLTGNAHTGAPAGKKARQPSLPNSSAKRTRPHRGSSFRRRAMKKPLWEGFFSAPERHRFPREEKSAEAGRTRGKTPRKRPAPRMSGITRMFRRCMAHGRRRKRLCCPHGSGRKPGKGRTMPRGKTGKAPQPEKVRTSAPAGKKAPSALSAERFGKENTAAQGSLLRRRAMKRSLGRLFLCPGASQGGPVRGKRR